MKGGLATWLSWMQTCAAVGAVYLVTGSRLHREAAFTFSPGFLRQGGVHPTSACVGPFCRWGRVGFTCVNVSPLNVAFRACCIRLSHYSFEPQRSWSLLSFLRSWKTNEYVGVLVCALSRLSLCVLELVCLEGFSPVD